MSSKDLLSSRRDNLRRCIEAFTNRLRWPAVFSTLGWENSPTHLMTAIGLFEQLPDHTQPLQMKKAFFDFRAWLDSLRLPLIAVTPTHNSLLAMAVLVEGYQLFVRAAIGTSLSSSQSLSPASEVFNKRRGIGRGKTYCERRVDDVPLHVSASTAMTSTWIEKLGHDFYSYGTMNKLPLSKTLENCNSVVTPENSHLLPFDAHSRYMANTRDYMDFKVLTYLQTYFLPSFPCTGVCTYYRACRSMKHILPIRSVTKMLHVCVPCSTVSVSPVRLIHSITRG